jgi:hypothetical protein
VGMPGCTLSTFAIRICVLQAVSRRKAHRRTAKQPPSFAFLSGEDYTDYLAKKHRSEVCSFSCRANSEPVSAPLQHGFRFLRHPLPAPPSAFLAVRFPRREEYGLTMFRISTMNRLGSAFTPVVRHLRRRSYKPPYLTTYLLVQASQHLWPALVTMLTAIHIC